jgi:polar amino acid transport system substrate-binding protein
VAGQEITIVRFAEETNWPPFTPDGLGRADSGLSLQLMQAIFSRLGIGVEVNLLPQKRMLETLKTGARAGATVISKNAERLRYLDYTEPLFAKRGYVYYRADRNPPLLWDDFADLEGLTIGVTDGHNYGDEFNNAVEAYKLTLFRVVEEKQGFDMLLAGRLDGFLCISLTANVLLREPGYGEKIVHAPGSYYDRDYHIAFSKKSPARALIPKVNAVIREMKADGSLALILSPYLK